MEKNIFDNIDITVKFILRDIEGNYYGGIKDLLNVWISCNDIQGKDLKESGVMFFDSFNKAKEWKYDKCNRACTIKKIVICSYIEETEMSVKLTPSKRLEFDRNFNILT